MASQNNLYNAKLKLVVCGKCIIPNVCALCLRLIALYTVSLFGILVTALFRCLKGSYDVISSFAFSLECYKLFVRREDP